MPEELLAVPAELTDQAEPLAELAEPMAVREELPAALEVPAEPLEELAALAEPKEEAEAAQPEQKARQVPARIPLLPSQAFPDSTPVSAELTDRFVPSALTRSYHKDPLSARSLQR